MKGGTIMHFTGRTWWPPYEAHSVMLGCYVTNSTMYSFTIIPALYVFKDCSAGFRRILIGMVDRFLPFSARNGTIQYRHCHTDSPLRLKECRIPLLAKWFSNAWLVYWLPRSLCRTISFVSLLATVCDTLSAAYGLLCSVGLSECRFSIPAPSQAALFRSLSGKRGRRKIISTPTGNEFVTFEIREIAPIAVAKKYAGIGSYGSNQKHENAV